MPGTNFHENITSQTQIINVNASLWYSKMASFRKNEGILVPICNIQIMVTIQVTRLKVGSFPYLYTMNLYTNFHSFLKIWVSSPYYLSLFDVEFPIYLKITLMNLAPPSLQHVELLYTLIIIFHINLELIYVSTNLQN